MRDDDFIVSIDPGETTGICAWWGDGRLVKPFPTKLDLDHTLDWLNQWGEEDISDFVVERWAYRKGMTKRGDTMISSQVVGAVRATAKRVGAKVHFQQPDILRIAALHANVKIPAKGHIDDGLSSYLHGFYWFEKQGILKPVLQQT